MATDVDVGEKTKTDGVSLSLCARRDLLYTCVCAQVREPGTLDGISDVINVVMGIVNSG